MKEKINNIGGFREVTMFFEDEIQNWTVEHNGVHFACTRQRKPLPTTQHGIQLTSTGKRDKQGIIYQYKGIIRLNHRYLRAFDAFDLTHVANRGCILIAVDNNNDRWVFGSPENPLFGRLEQVVGSKPGDLHRWQLSLEGSGLTAEQALL